MIGKYVDLNNYNKLFSKMDQNYDELISEEEFIWILKQDKSLLNILHAYILFIQVTILIKENNYFAFIEY